MYTVGQKTILEKYLEKVIYKEKNMKKIVFTDEQIADIINMYQDKSVRFDDILKKHGLSSNTVIKVIDSNNIPRRQKRHKKTARRCSHCGALIEISEAKYCPFCGHDIMTECERMQRDLKNLVSLTAVIPQSDRDRFRDTILKAVAFIKKENNNA
jgi:predicted RNA-binding Zn-ribbon protein involved in translation (DUF1610 family)